MKPNKFRKPDAAEFTGQRQETEEQSRLRLRWEWASPGGVKRYRELRRDRARMLGVLRERELDPAKAQAAADAAQSAKKSGGKKKGK